MAENSTLERRTLSDQLAEKLAQDIAFRRIPPGTRLREIELAERFDVSRPLIREVLRKLEELGLVENTPWKGANVPILTAQELADLHDFAGHMFAFVVRLASERATKAQLDTIRQHTDRLAQLARRADTTPEVYEIERTEARSSVERACGTIYALARRRSIIRGLGHQFSLDNIRSRKQREASARRWGKLYDLISARKPEAAFEHALVMYAETRQAMLDAHGECEKAAKAG